MRSAKRLKRVHGTCGVPCVAGGASSWECVQQKKKPERRWWNHNRVHIRPRMVDASRGLEREMGKRAAGSVYMTRRVHMHDTSRQ